MENIIKAVFSSNASDNARKFDKDKKKEIEKSTKIKLNPKIDSKKKGTYVGRVAVRASGSFNITTKEGTTQGISYRFCRLLQKSDGYQYGNLERKITTKKKTNASIPPRHKGRSIQDAQIGERN